jgi:hypothetical protein
VNVGLQDWRGVRERETGDAVTAERKSAKEGFIVIKMDK